MFKDTVCVFGTADSFNSSQLLHVMKNKRNMAYLSPEDNLAVLASLGEDESLFPVNKATDTGLSG